MLNTLKHCTMEIEDKDIAVYYSKLAEMDGLELTVCGETYKVLHHDMAGCNTLESDKFSMGITPYWEGEDGIPFVIIDNDKDEVIHTSNIPFTEHPTSDNFTQAIFIAVISEIQTFFK